ILIPSESVEFKLTTDDGGSLAIDGKRIIDDPGPHAEKAATGTYRGSAGWHSINIEHHDEGGGTRMELLWKTDATDYRTIPADALKPDTKG
ncbi:MAG: PA14 domain-containing protein, partial [Candidatus Omnitrophota bacterium]